MADVTDPNCQAIAAGDPRCADLFAILLADIATERYALRALRTLAWLAATTFGIVAFAIWMCGSGRSLWEGPAWVAGALLAVGLLCDGSAALVKRLRWRLERKIVDAGITSQGRDANFVQPSDQPVTRPGTADGRVLK